MRNVFPLKSAIQSKIHEGDHGFHVVCLRLVAMKSSVIPPHVKGPTAACARIAVLARHVNAEPARDCVSGSAVTREHTASAASERASRGRYKPCGGPLDEDRKHASFDSARLRNDWDGAELVAFKDKVWARLAEDPLFRSPVAELELSRDAHRRLTYQQFTRIMDWDLLKVEDLMANPMLVRRLHDWLATPPCLCWALSSLTLLQGPELAFALGAYDWCVWPVAWDVGQQQVLLQSRVPQVPGREVWASPANVWRYRHGLGYARVASWGARV